MAVNEKIRAVNECFLRKQIKLDFEWLNGYENHKIESNNFQTNRINILYIHSTSCVQFFLEENPNIPIDMLFREAEEQWELSDLSDSGVSCLPNSLFTRKDMHMIDGTFAVQMQTVLDISQPAYDQLQKLEDKELDVGIENPEFIQTTQATQQQQQQQYQRINM